MSRRFNCCRLRGLIGSFLSDSNEGSEMLTTEEKERPLLIVLSQALRELDMEEHETERPAICFLSAATAPKRQPLERGCLTVLMEDLIALLRARSQFVQHLAVSVLVKISVFLSDRAPLWNGFICHFCSCMELAIKELLPSSTLYLAASCKNFEPGSSHSGDAFCDESDEANWSQLAALFQVLRSILKNLDDEDENKFLLYVEYVSSTLKSIPWHLFSKICFWPNSSGDCVSKNCSDIVHVEPKLLYLGNLVRFLCSFVQQMTSLEGTSSCLSPVLAIIIKIVPDALHCCLSKQGKSGNICIFQYFRHKLLMLMIRLSFQYQLKCSTLVSWLKLLDLYFIELLEKPIYKLDPVEGDFMDDSPFLWSLYNNEASDFHYGHLQRLCFFLFLRCSISSIMLKQSSVGQCDCITLSNDECYARKKGFLGLSNWMKRCIPNQSFAVHELPMGTIIGFSTTFIQLFMCEDDLLFKMLLQLISAPFSAQNLSIEERLFLQGDEKVIFHCLSVLFNPVRLFHVFLSELKYDHQVLLDYVISKDTGTSCVEYLLRSLRAVCDSWDLFLEFPEDKQLQNILSSKKRKILPHDLDSETSESVFSFGEQSRSNFETFCERGGRRCPYQDARNCLLCLKKSIETLRHKKLFPYNPEALIKRLTRFQALSLNQ